MHDLRVALGNLGEAFVALVVALRLQVIELVVTARNNALARSKTTTAPVIEAARPAPVAQVIELRTVEVRQQRKLAERRDSSMFDLSSVVPPNIERAVTSQMRASHKDRIPHDDLLRFLTGFGVPKGDARGAVTVTRARTRRDYVIADDLQAIQTWIGKGWIDSRKRSLGDSLPNVLRRQLGFAADAPLEANAVAEVLATRGYRIGTANDIAAKLCGRSEVAQAQAR